MAEITLNTNVAHGGCLLHDAVKQMKKDDFPKEDVRVLLSVLLSDNYVTVEEAIELIEQFYTIV